MRESTLWSKVPELGGIVPEETITNEYDSKGNTVRSLKSRYFNYTGISYSNEVVIEYDDKICSSAFFFPNTACPEALKISFDSKLNNPTKLINKYPDPTKQLTVTHTYKYNESGFVTKKNSELLRSNGTKSDLGETLYFYLEVY